MSLINDMLRDLEERKEPAPAEPGEAVAAASTSTHIASVRPWVLALPVLILGAVAAGFWWNLATAPKESEAMGDVADVVSPTAPAASLDSVETSLTHVEENILAADSAPLATATEIPAQPTANSSVVVPQQDIEPRNTDTPLQQLLAEAEEALSRNRLTLPSGASALDLFRRALAEYPQSELAQRGVSRVVERYQQFIVENLEAGNLAKVEALLLRAREKELAIDFAAFETRLQLSRESREHHEIKKSGKARVDIEETLQSKDAAVAATGWQAYRDGQVAQAIMVLEAFVVSNPHAELSRLRLFEIYLQQTNFNGARSLLVYWQAEPVKHQYYAARVLVAEGRQTEALAQLDATSTGALRSLLTAGVIDATLFEKYNALQAALYQGAENWMAAAEKYQMLVAMNAQNTGYWLGYAVSSDALGHYKNARVAYQQLVRQAAVQPELYAFVKERLQVLDTKLRDSGANVASGGF